MALSGTEYFDAVADAARRGFGGGRICDLLIRRCALKADAEGVYTLDLPEFTRLAPNGLREKSGTVS